MKVTEGLHVNAAKTKVLISCYGRGLEIKPVIARVEYLIRCAQQFDFLIHMQTMGLTQNISDVKVELLM